MNILVDIHKPLYVSDGKAKVYIRDTFINKAIRFKRKLEIRVPGGYAIVDPKEWMKKGDRMEKVFLRPDEPMILFGGVIEVTKKTEEEKEKEKNELLIKALN